MRAILSVIAYQIDRDAHLITCRVTIGVRVLDVSNFIEQLFADPHFEGNFHTLVVIDDATVTPDITARNALAELLVSWRKLHASARWALVLPGSAWRRIAVQLIEDHGLSAHDVRCFAEEAAALAWLQESPYAAAAL